MSLSNSLQRFLTLYEFDQGATDFALEHMVGEILSVGDSGAYITREEKTKLLKRAFSDLQQTIVHKTLIEVGTNQDDLDQLADDLASQGYDNKKWTPTSARVQALIYKVLRQNSVELSFEDEVDLQTKLEKIDEDARIDLIATLTKADLPTGLARWFAQNLDVAAAAISGMDETDFKTLVPEALQQAFRECHVNAALGNYLTTIIVCGVILERGLKDLTNEDRKLEDLIAIAHDESLLVGRYLAMAKHVKKRRNDAAHKLCVFTSDEAWDVLIHTRKLISHLYRGRS